MLKKISMPLLAATMFLNGATLHGGDNPATAVVSARDAAIEARRLERQALAMKKTGLVDVTPQAVRRLIGMLQDQREQLELDEAGAAGRRKGLQEAIAKLSSRLEDQTKADEVSAELTHVAQAREVELARIKQLIAQGAASANEASSAEANLAAARADLARAKQKNVNTSPAGQALEEWNRQLLELSVASEERMARLQYLEKRLSELSDSLNAVDAQEQ